MPTVLRNQTQHRDGLIEQFRTMTQEVSRGHFARAIHYINSATLKTDVEAILHRQLKPEECKALLLAPAHINSQTLAKAAYAARELQAIRMVARRFLQNTKGRVDPASVKEMLEIIERAEKVMAAWAQEDHEREVGEV